LQSKGISNVAEVGDFIPNVEIDKSAAFSGTSSALVSFVRGIGQSDFAITFEPGVGLYVDGVYYARVMGSIIDLMDVENVEVLKGPQGTLFGRNTIGGAINISTKKPSIEFRARGEVTTGSFNRMDTKLTMDLPISDKL